MKRFISLYFIIIAIIFIFGFCFFIPTFSNYGEISKFTLENNTNLSFEISNSNLMWPTPGYTTITSPFGYRKSPTAGSGTYHGGIDIGAPMRHKYYSM